MTGHESRAYAEVIGDPIAQSKSPAIHGFWLEQLKIPADYRAERVSEELLSGYLASRRADTNWRGCNVTMPLKQSVIPLLDTIEPDAAKIGAVNTVIRNDDGQLIGANTDAQGFCEPLSAMLSQDHLFRMARIVGTGGAARAIITALYSHGFTLVIAARNQAKARALLDELAPEGEHYTAPVGHFAEPTGFAFDDRDGCLDLVVNASSLGMRNQDPLAFDLTHAPPRSLVYDIVTDPVQTDLLLRAKEGGFEVIDGLSMLIGQAAIAFERFFGQPAPREQDSELRAILEQ